MSKSSLKAEASSDKMSTVVGGWSTAVLQALDALGFSGKTILKEAGINTEEALNPDARFTATQTRTLWQHAKQKTGQEAIGLQVAKFVCPTTFHALGFSLWSSNTLADALQRMVLFDAILNSGCTLELSPCIDSKRGLIMHIKQQDNLPLVSAEGVDYFLAAVTKLFRDIRGPGFNPSSVSLTREAPSTADQWQQFFQCPVEFGTSSNQLCFDNDKLNKPLPTANTTLAEENDKIVESYLCRLKTQDIASQVRASLIKLMPLGITTMEHVAKELNITPRTLQYKLSQEQTNIQQVRDQTRQDLAKHYLSNTQDSLTQITYSLGFSDPAHFNRAFKRWTGVSPTSFRHH